MVKHCVVGREKSRESEVDGRCQAKLVCPVGMSARSLENENGTYPKQVRNIEQPSCHNTGVGVRVYVIEEPGQSERNWNYHCSSSAPVLSIWVVIKRDLRQGRETNGRESTSKNESTQREKVGPGCLFPGLAEAR